MGRWWIGFHPTLLKPLIETINNVQSEFKEKPPGQIYKLYDCMNSIKEGLCSIAAFPRDFHERIALPGDMLKELSVFTWLYLLPDEIVKVDMVDLQKKQEMFRIDEAEILLEQIAKLSTDDDSDAILNYRENSVIIQFINAEDNRSSSEEDDHLYADREDYDLYPVDEDIRELLRMAEDLEKSEEIEDEEGSTTNKQKDNRSSIVEKEENEKTYFNRQDVEFLVQQIKQAINSRKEEEEKCFEMFISDPINPIFIGRQKTPAIFYVLMAILTERLHRDSTDISGIITKFVLYLDEQPFIREMFKKYEVTYIEITPTIKSMKHFHDKIIKLLRNTPEIQEQIQDLIKINWHNYFNKWMKTVVTNFEYSGIEMIKQLGYGSEGEAYYCKTSEYLSPVVMKVYTNLIVNQAGVDEINSLMTLQAHPHIVRLFGTVVNNGQRLGFLMEYCEGGSLDQVIRKQDYTYRKHWTFHWMVQVASGLKFLHENGIIYRDVKPANMLLGHGNRLLKLSDMTICKHLGKSKQALTTAKGTFGYMAPEVFEDDGYSFPSDMFSFGRSIAYFGDPIDEHFAATILCPLLEMDQKINGDINLEEEFKHLVMRNISTDQQSVKFRASIWDYYKQRKPDSNNQKIDEKIQSWLLILTASNPDKRPSSSIIFNDFREFYEQQLEKIDTKEKMELQFFPTS